MKHVGNGIIKKSQSEVDLKEIYSLHMSGTLELSRDIWLCYFCSVAGLACDTHQGSKMHLKVWVYQPPGRAPLPPGAQRKIFTYLPMPERYEKQDCGKPYLKYHRNCSVLVLTLHLSCCPSLYS